VRIYVLLIIFLVIQAGCGRKQKDIFYFSKEEALPRINRLSLPCIKQITCKKDGCTNKISWKLLPLINSYDKGEALLLGYNVYRLVSAYFVPKKPLNKKQIITDNFYLDEQVAIDPVLKKEQKHCYVVRGVFKINNRKIIGPSSRIVCIKK